jgi:hypothetical protein
MVAVLTLFSNQPPRRKKIAGVGLLTWIVLTVLSVLVWESFPFLFFLFYGIVYLVLGIIWFVLVALALQDEDDTYADTVVTTSHSTT